MEAREVLCGAVRVLQEDGWVRRAYVKPDGYCLYGALGKACGTSDNDMYDGVIPHINLEALDAIQQTLLRRGFHESIVDFNDAHGRTGEEVIGLLEETIQAMDIGTERETVIIEPVESPVPVEAPVEEPEPVETPAETPELVPA